MILLRAAPMMVCAVPRVWRKCQNRNLCLLFAKFDPLWSQIDPLWSQSQPKLSRLQDQNTKMSELSRLQDQNTKMSFPFKRFTTMPFTACMCTFPELGLHCAFSGLSRTLKLGLQSNLSWLSKSLYNLFLYENLIQFLGSWAQNVVVVRSVKVKSCSVMELQLMLSLCIGMFRLSQNSFFSNNLFSRQHLYYQSLGYFRVVGNHAQGVKYLDRVDVNIDYRATVRSKERYYQARKSRDREPSRINERKIFKFMKKRTG